MHNERQEELDNIYVSREMLYKSCQARFKVLGDRKHKL